MGKYQITFKVTDGVISRKSYEFQETIEADNPRDAFSQARELARESSTWITRWNVKDIRGVK